MAPIAAVIEIVERNRSTDDTAGGSTVAPDDIRINGISLLAPEGHPVKVHPIEVTGRPNDLVCVTLTLFARRVTIAAEDDLATDREVV